MGNTNDEINRQSLAKTEFVGFDNKPLTLCYANSVLQVLFHHPIFISIITKNQFKKGIIPQLRNLWQQIKSKGPKQSINTNLFMKWVEHKSALFSRQSHQDSHQFYLWLMNQINTQMKAKQNLSTKFQQEFFYKKVTRTICQFCDQGEQYCFICIVSQRQEESVDLSLVLPEPNVSLNTCISNYSKPEQMKGNNKFECQKCQTLVNAKKSNLLKTLPKFLAIHLERFKYDSNTRKIIKLNWMIPFAPKMKMSTNCDIQNSIEQVYKLVGIVAHLGQGQMYGHYISYIKINTKWYVFNDDEITPTEDYLIQSLWGYKGYTKCAYMLFYTL